MRAAQKAMNIPGNAVFDQAMQDRMARWIARNQGLGAGEGLKHNPRAMAQASAALREGGALDAPTGVAGNGGGGAGATGATGSILSDMQRLKASGKVVEDQCVALGKASVGASGAVTTWRRGEGAEAGNLKPGTPVATFLNRDGSQSNRYAGGGTGTMGAGLDHAGVFEGYVRDRNGNITGMRIAEQYRGSGGVRSKVYPFGQGRGERNGSNYAAVLGPDGQPLGGSRNPMSGGAVDSARNVLTPRLPPSMTEGGETGGGAVTDQFGNTLGRSAPTRGRLGENIPPRMNGGGRRAGAGGGGITVGSVHITVAGAGDPQAVAKAVNDHFRSAVNQRAHDIDPTAV